MQHNGPFSIVHHCLANFNMQPGMTFPVVSSLFSRIPACKHACALLFATLTLISLSANAREGGDFSAELGLEGRFFIEDGLQGQDRFQPSMRTLLEYQSQYDNNSFHVAFFGRIDKEDEERSHVDIREAYWTHVADGWEMRLGVSKVFWGVTESRHLVDIINQTDLVENIDAEDKLGQPMLKLGVEREWGNLDFFWLPYFRERTFPGKDGRLNSLPFPVDTDKPRFESSAENWHSDFAVRYAVTIDNLDLALSHFSGTSRNPYLEFNGSFTEPAFVPVYRQIDQTGLELQYIVDAWLLKFEGITSSGVNQRYSAAVFGFEYTQVGIFDSFADLGWIVEYLFDDRRNQTDPAKIAQHSFERDVFLGWRYAFNDMDSSEILTGVIYDPETEESLFSLEYSQRLANDLKLFVELRAFQGAESQSVNASQSLRTQYLKDEDYLQLELVKYF